MVAPGHLDLLLTRQTPVGRVHHGDATVLLRVFVTVDETCPRERRVKLRGVRQRPGGRETTAPSGVNRRQRRRIGIGRPDEEPA